MATTTPREPARRLSLSEIVEQQIGALSRTHGEHSSVKLARNAKGDVQIEVAVRTGESGVDTIEDAQDRAQQVFDHLAGIYPLGADSV